MATAGAGGGNSPNAKLCQKGGWVNVQGDDETQFINEQNRIRVLKYRVGLRVSGATSGTGRQSALLSFSNTRQTELMQ